ncbi:MAG: enoyl-CoA hydratase/isomerase family protein [Candidatus Obscuribacter sp.]|nr:enoyl-CoA hydratase/isomerase family protein [Candidatus Obscuribacter sp.]MBP6349407.1 enoyl-CoA hydratase/isomerase family protein [Candidatus Obscuribacter sp.]MBP6592156.1 enoyl-CoA hydratase/isomerase family protein [Candidatus Obscuribacter sp.]
MAKIVTLNMLEGGIAHIVIDTPESKLNVLSQEFFAEFTATMDALEARTDVRGLVVSSGKEDCFFAGADVKEIRFLQTRPAQEIYQACKSGRDAVNRLSKLPYPTVAAISGTCLGGGLELTLACKYRVASTNPKTQLGVPEVLLGFIPGWGGTVRLPRLLGLQDGFTMISTGNKSDATKAWRQGLVDETTAQTALLTRAIEIARGAKPNRYNKSFQQKAMEYGLSTPAGRMLFQKQATNIIMSQTRGKYPAPLEALKVILKTWGMPEDKAFEIECQAFARLATSAVSRSLVGIFFAETESKKMPEGVKPSITVKTVGVIGAGVMGAGIAQSAAYAGYRVVLKDIDQAALDKGMNAIKELFDGLVAKRKMSRAEADMKYGAVKGTLAYADMADCDLVIEAVVEKMGVKKAVIAECEKVITKPFIFGTNTSSLSVNEMARAATNPSNVVGLHFFNPVHKMKLVEVVAADTSSDETVAAAKAFGMKVGKTTVVTGDGPGFVVNRILSPYMKESIQLLLEGVPADQIDKAATRFGMPMGPIALMDEVGLDIVSHVIKVMHAALGDRLAPPSIIATIEQHKLLGKKGGKGLYLYDEKGKRAGLNPDIQAVLTATPKTMSESAIQDRLFLPMVNEAALCLSEGVITDPSQLDLAMIFGSGFAPFLGGVLGYADSIGVRTVYQKLNHLSKVAGANYKPAKLIADKAAKGEAFYPRG